MATSIRFTLIAILVSAAAPAATVRVTDGTTKIRPADALPPATSAAISAARNEYEGFQVVVQAASTATSALKLSSYSWSGPLAGPNGATIPAANVRVFAEVMQNVTMASGPDGATGPWPDALIPDVDDIVGQKRNAFTKWWSVAPGTNGVIYVEVHVPDDVSLPAGPYLSTLNLSFSDGTSRGVPVTLTVWDFRLPSTSSLPSAFGVSIDSICRAMNGTTWCNNVADMTSAAVPWARFLLDHRISSSVVQSGPDGLGSTCNLWADPPTCDWSQWDPIYAPLLDGTDPSLHLKGAKLTTIKYVWRASFTDPAAMRQHRAWALHFRDKGWFDRTFDYTCDEPPATCAWSDIPKRAAIVHTADPAFRTMVTTTWHDASANDPTFLADIDVIDPPLNNLSDKPGKTDFGNQRSAYGPWTSTPQRGLWWYQSCMSHGCGNATSTDSYWRGWQADYVIDASGVKNRAMEWLSYLFRMQGELYYDTVGTLSTAFTDQSGFGGTGDGNLLYPGTVANIGKIIRDGMEDYEYLRLVAAGDPAFADAVVRGVFPDPSTYVPDGAPRPSAPQLLSARAQLAQRILELEGAVPPRPVFEAPMHASVVADGALGEWSGAPGITLDPQSVGSDNSASVRLAWDATNLYAAFSVTDASIVVNQGGRDGELWNGDSVELMIDTSAGASASIGPRAFHLLVNASGDLTDERGTTAGTWDRSWTSNATYKQVRTAAGYDVELALPWSSLGIAPCAGLRLGVDVAVNDVDVAGGSPKPADWARLSSFAQPARWGVVTLGKHVLGTLYPIQLASGPLSLDGSLSELAGAPYIDLSDALAAAGSDNRATARVAWDATGLYFGFDVTDAALVVNQGGTDGEVWNGDGVEVMLHLGAPATALSSADFHLLANANGDVTDERGATGGWNRSWNLTARQVSVVRKPSGGYTVEMAIPWADLGIAAPPAGTRIGLDLALNDVDVPGVMPKQVDWAGLTAFAQPAKWRGGRLEAAPACSAP